jgi:hypothetical protein
MKKIIYIKSCLNFLLFTVIVKKPRAIKICVLLVNITFRFICTRISAMNNFAHRINSIYD